MSKKFGLLLLLVLIALPMGVIQAQTPVTLTFDKAVTGEITDQNFEALYQFEGTAGDIVFITLTRVDEADFDPYLYLTTLDNEEIATNDDFNGLDSGIIVRLPETQTYQIVATRRGDRTGEGTGAFELLLSRPESVVLGNVIEGAAAASDTRVPTYILAPETSGVFTITYGRTSGEYSPSLIVSMIEPGMSYDTEVARVSAAGLYRGTVTLDLAAENLYILTLENAYYSWDDTVTANFTLQVEETPQ